MGLDKIIVFTRNIVHKIFHKPRYYSERKGNVF